MNLWPVAYRWPRSRGWQLCLPPSDNQGWKGHLAGDPFQIDALVAYWCWYSSVFSEGRGGSREIVWCVLLLCLLLTRERERERKGWYKEAKKKEIERKRTYHSWLSIHSSIYIKHGRRKTEDIGIGIWENICRRAYYYPGTFPVTWDGTRAST